MTGSVRNESNRQSVISMSTINSDTGRGRNAWGATSNYNDRMNLLKRGSTRGTGFNNPYGANFQTSDGRLSPTPSHGQSYNDSNSGSGFTPTIGFASNLTHAVIREHDDETQSAHSHVSTDTVDDDLNDDELALYGAPWAKEGMLWKRTGDEPMRRKTTKKDWKQFFVVVQQGELLLFTFGSSSGSGAMTFGAVGGGNWLVSCSMQARSVV